MSTLIIIVTETLEASYHTYVSLLERTVSAALPSMVRDFTSQAHSCASAAFSPAASSSVIVSIPTTVPDTKLNGTAIDAIQHAPNLIRLYVSMVTTTEGELRWG